jgi:L1 cell adhesion molecule like protein
MCKIMDKLHAYVPTITTTKTIQVPNGDSIDIKIDDVFETPFGGDYLTMARARSAVSVRANHETATEQLKGLFPTIEDWHTRMTLMKVS